jgi:hypothetical protein
MWSACCGPPALAEQPCFHAGACCSPHPQLGRVADEMLATSVRVLAVTQSPSGVAVPAGECADAGSGSGPTDRKTELDSVPPPSIDAADVDVVVAATQTVTLSGTQSNRPKAPPPEIPSDSRSGGQSNMVVMNRFPSHHRTVSPDVVAVESRPLSGSSAILISPNLVTPPSPSPLLILGSPTSTCICD